QGIMRKALDMAIATSSYDELMLFSIESDTMMNDLEYNIKNPVISTRKGRPPGRAKSNVEIQNQQVKKRQHFTEEHEIQEKDTRKTCQN
ncbi:13902_t:CDS:2, partial [Racocetra fulgida]